MSERVVTKTGLTSTATTLHLTLTLLTCGLWSPIWVLHWLIASRKQVTVTARLPPPPPPRSLWEYQG